MRYQNAFRCGTVLTSLALLMACGPAPTGTSAPAPTSPDGAITAAPAPTGGAAVQGLSSIRWEWVGSTDAAGTATAVNDPTRYTLLLNADGTLSIKSDCNSVGGTYTTSGTDTLALTLGASTEVGCPPDSQDQQFNAQLGSVTRWRTEGGELLLTPSDGSTMRFREAVAVAEPALMLIGPVWEWAGRTQGDTATGIGEPDRYTITFRGDGTLGIKADCNSVGGTYTSTASGTLTITIGASTKVACPPDSQDQVWLQELAAVQSFTIANGQLTLTSASGTTSYQPQQQ